MDKDLLRIVIISVGAVIILGMILWGVLSNQSKRKKQNFYGNKDPLDNIDPSLVVSTDADDFDIVPLNTDAGYHPQVKTRQNADYIDDALQKSGDDSLEPDLDFGMDLDLDLDIDIEEELLRTLDQSTEISKTTALKESLPPLIQLSFVAKIDTGFSGNQLLEAFKNVGLVYGSVKVFERLDYLNQVDYAVASMIGPGIFPEDDWENYTCPGVTFFLQPREVDNAAVVFDEMLETIGQLSSLLKGDVLDQNQQLLTEGALQQIKASLV